LAGAVVSTPTFTARVKRYPLVASLATLTLRPGTRAAWLDRRRSARRRCPPAGRHGGDFGLARRQRKRGSAKRLECTIICPDLAGEIILLLVQIPA
jgi:hypothetical protein